MLIDKQGAAVAQREPGGRGERGLRADSGGEQDQVGGDLGSVRQARGDGAAARFPQCGDRRAQPHLDAGAAQFQFDAARHLRVQGRHDLPGQLDKRDRQAAVPQRLGRLQANEPGTNDHCPAGAAVHQLTQHVHIGNGAQHPDRGQAGSRDRRDDRRGPGGQHQHVIGLVIVPAGRALTDGDGTPGRVDGQYLVAGPHVQRQARRQRLRGMQQEGIPVTDLAAQVIGQAAVRIRDVGVPLKHHDLRVLGEAAGPRREAHAPSDPADHDNLHLRAPIFFVSRARGLPAVEAGSSRTVAAVLGRYPGEGLLHMLAAASPGDLLAAVADSWAAHGYS